MWLLSHCSPSHLPSSGIRSKHRNTWLYLFVCLSLTWVLGVELRPLCLRGKGLGLATSLVPVVMLFWETTVARGPAHSGLQKKALCSGVPLPGPSGPLLGDVEGTYGPLLGIPSVPKWGGPMDGLCSPKERCRASSHLPRAQHGTQSPPPGLPGDSLEHI